MVNAGTCVESNLIIIGGSEDKKGEKVILNRVCSLIDKEEEMIVIATVATEKPEEAGGIYKNLFSEMGVKKISILNVESRKDAYITGNIDIVKEAKLIFFTGGDQLRITSILGGTPLNRVLVEKSRDGCIFVGTSAGASVMSDTMIIDGEDEESPKKCTLNMAPGLGLIRGVVIDQHFAQRGRIGRLLTGIAENPERLGIGIDENTAIQVNRDGVLQVVGSGAVYMIDGSEISDSNVSEQHSKDILSIFDVKMHVLKAGDWYDLNRRRPFNG